VAGGADAQGKNVKRDPDSIEIDDQHLLQEIQRNKRKAPIAGKVETAAEPKRTTSAADHRQTQSNAEESQLLQKGKRRG